MNKIEAWLALKNTTLLPVWIAAEHLGVSERQFRNIVKKLNIEPDDETPNPHYLSGPKCKLYSRNCIRSLKKRVLVRKIIDKNCYRNLVECRIEDEGALE